MAKQLTIEQFEGFDELSAELENVGRDNKQCEPGSREHILNLQLVMATTSVNHGYAQMEYDETNSWERKDELMQYMSDCRAKYEEARDELSVLNPLVLESFESELSFQKRTTMNHYHA